MTAAIGTLILLFVGTWIYNDILRGLNTSMRQRQERIWVHDGAFIAYRTPVSPGTDIGSGVGIRMAGRNGPPRPIPKCKPLPRIERDDGTLIGKFFKTGESHIPEVGDPHPTKPGYFCWEVVQDFDPWPGQIKVTWKNERTDHAKRTSSL